MTLFDRIRYWLDIVLGHEADRLLMLRLMARRARADRAIRRLRGRGEGVATYTEWADDGRIIIAQFDRPVPFDVLLACAHLSHEDADLLYALHDIDILRHAVSLHKLQHELTHE